MAAKKGTPAAAGSNGKANDAELEGFIETGSADFDAGFWDPKASPVIAGRLLGGYDMPDVFNKGGRRYYIQLKVLAPVTVVKDKQSYTAERGETVSVGITNRLESILTDHVPIVRAGGNVQIKITAEGKKKTRSGNSVWVMTVGHKLVSGPTGPVMPFIKRNDPPAGAIQAPRGQATSTPAADDDVPF